MVLMTNKFVPALKLYELTLLNYHEKLEWYYTTQKFGKHRSLMLFNLISLNFFLTLITAGPTQQTYRQLTI
jgi:hypothetical protein